MKEFHLEGNEYIELKNLLKLVGFFNSGGEAMVSIAEGKIMVNGNVELRKRCKIHSGQIVEFKGNKILVK
ncbi:MAG: RNA-binding protein [Deltaproteobacteria bacterium CG07_land_8_20_14_0_80_38_7]|nr:MAG: RNA-binding protein [Deltaproteobacteria bacterium CG07_land_8_20_14_0_80_38_7]